MKLFATMLVTGCLASVVFAEPEIKGTPTELTQYLDGIPKTVFVNGEAEVKVQADRAYVSLKVSSEARSLEDALAKNAALRQLVIDALKKNGIPEENIAGSKFASKPEYGMFSDKAKSYKIDNTIKVTIADESQLRVVASSIDEHSDVQYDGITFENSKEAETKREALAKALESTTAKKKLYEEKLGIKLTPITFSEGQVYTAAPPPYRAKSLYGASAEADSAMLAMAPASVGAGTSHFGEIVYRAVVTVQYELIAD